MTTFKNRRFARAIGAMGAAVLMAVAPAAIVETAVPTAQAQDEPVPVVTETATETVTVEEEEEPVPPPAPAPAPEPVPAPGNEPVPAPTDDAVEAPAESSEETTTESEEPAARSRASRAVVPGAPNCSADTIWVSDDGDAYELTESNGMWVRTQRSVRLDQEGETYLAPDGYRRNYSFGSGVAMSPDGTTLWGAPYYDRGLSNNADTSQIKLRWVNVDTGDHGDLRINVAPRDLGTTVGLRHFNSLSFSRDGRHLFLASRQVSTVWKIDTQNPDYRNNTESFTMNLGSNVRGHGGDFIALPDGGTLGIRSDGMLLRWPGDPVTSNPRAIGRVNYDGGGAMPTIQGLAKVGDDIFVVDGYHSGGEAYNDSRGMYKLPDNFLQLLEENPTAYNTNTLWESTKVTDKFTDVGFWDLTSAQDSFYCEPVTATFKVEKRPQSDQMPEVEGDQPNAKISADGFVSSFYDVVVTNNGTEAAAPTNPVVDRVTLPAGFRLANITATFGDVERNSTTDTIEISPEDIGEIPPGGSVTISIRVDANVDATTRDRVATNPDEFTCTSATPETADNPKGMFNAVSLEGEDDPLASTNNQACVTPTFPPFEIEKGPRPTPDNQGAVPIGPNGTAELVYTVTVKNSSNIEGTTPVIEDRFWIPENVEPSGAARISVNDATGVEGMPTSWTAAQVEAAKDPGQPALKLADSVTLAGEGTRTFTIRIPISVNVAAADWEELGTCTAGDGGSYAGGVPNTVFMADDKSADNNDACIPLLPPELASLTINKVGFDTVDNEEVVVSLDGAEFDLYPAADDESFDPNATPIAGPVGDPPKWENLTPGKYYLVETKSPAGYQLLPQPVGITIGATEAAYGVGIDDDDVAVAQPVATDSIDLVVQVNDIKTGNLPLTGPADQAFWYAMALVTGLAMVLLNLGLFRREV